VIHDELDFPLGALRIHTRRSSAGHNGIESIIGALGTQDFLRIRIRRGAGAEGGRWPALLAVADAQGGSRGDRCCARYRRRGGVKVILKEGPAAAMNRFNRKKIKISHGLAQILTDQDL